MIKYRFGLFVSLLMLELLMDKKKKISILIDVASLSLKYTDKALSARLFLIPGKKAGEFVSFENFNLTACRVMKIE